MHRKIRGNVVLSKRDCNNVYVRYGLAPILIRIVLEHGKNVGWDEVALLLEDYVLEKHGMEISIKGDAACAYYKKITVEGATRTDDIATFRRNMGEKWVRTLEAIYDQIADSKILLEAAFKNRNSRDYVLISKNLQDIMKLLAEIHQSANFNVILREQIIGVIHGIIGHIKEYPFPVLTEIDINALEKIQRGGKTRRGLKESKLRELKRELLQYVIARLPELSDMFTAGESESPLVADVRNDLENRLDNQITIPLS